MFFLIWKNRTILFQSISEMPVNFYKHLKKIDAMFLFFAAYAALYDILSSILYLEWGTPKMPRF